MRGKMFYFVAQTRVRRELRERGYAFREIRAFMLVRQDETIDQAAKEAGVEGELNAAIGDGTIIAAIIEFLNSPAGQKLLEALIALLLGMIG